MDGELFLLQTHQRAIHRRASELRTHISQSVFRKKLALISSSNLNCHFVTIGDALLVDHVQYNVCKSNYNL